MRLRAAEENFSATGRAISIFREERNFWFKTGQAKEMV